MVGSAAVETALVVLSQSCTVGLHVSMWAWPSVGATAWVVEVVADLYAIYLPFALSFAFLALALGLCGQCCSVCCSLLLL